jgi:hypothetical protein
VVLVWSSLSPGHGLMSCCLPKLSRALSSARRASRSFWCSEQAARCSDSSCLRDSEEEQWEVMVDAKAEVFPARTFPEVGWSRQLLKALG